MNGGHTLGLEPALEAVDVLDAQLLGPVDLGRGLVEELEEPLQSVDVLDHGRADHCRRDVPERRAECERQPTWAQLDKINQGRAAVRRVDREAQPSDGVRSLSQRLAGLARERDALASTWSPFGPRSCCHLETCRRLDAGEQLLDGGVNCVLAAREMIEIDVGRGQARMAEHALHLLQGIAEQTTIRGA